MDTDKKIATLEQTIKKLMAAIQLLERKEAENARTVRTMKHKLHAMEQTMHNKVYTLEQSIRSLEQKINDIRRPR